QPACAFAGGKVTVAVSSVQVPPATFPTVPTELGNCCAPPWQVYDGSSIREWGREPLCRTQNETLYWAAPIGRLHFGPWKVCVRLVSRRLLVPPCAWAVVIPSVPPVLPQPAVVPDSKFGLPTRLCPSVTVTTRSSMKRLGSAVGDSAAVWLR